MPDGIEMRKMPLSPLVATRRARWFYALFVLQANLLTCMDHIELKD
jgi:hypothetical protein